MQSIPKIISVKPVDDLHLIVEFDNGVIKNYDVNPLLGKFEAFNQLLLGDLFALAKVENGGIGVSWTEKIDLSRYEIWEHGAII